MRTFALRCLAIAALSGLEWTLASSAWAESLVKFDSAPRHVEQNRGGDGAGALTHQPDLQGYLTRPRGRGPFPAVVLLHSCLGLPVDRRSIAEMIAGWGYVALFVDDFTTRGIRETCAVDFKQALSDAYGALAFVSRLPYVDSARIAAIGFSQGADTALEIASRRFASDFVRPEDQGFKAAAAFFPPCDNQASARLEIPTLILIGGLDEVTPAADCERLAARQGARSNVKLVVFPGARHFFNDPEFAGGKRVLGMLLEYDRNAAERSKSELRDFLARKLAR